MLTDLCLTCLLRQNKCWNQKTEKNTMKECLFPHERVGGFNFTRLQTGALGEPPPHPHWYHGKNLKIYLNYSKRCDWNLHPSLIHEVDFDTSRGSHTKRWVNKI